jgi:hypothetical protein
MWISLILAMVLLVGCAGRLQPPSWMGMTERENVKATCERRFMDAMMNPSYGFWLFGVDPAAQGVFARDECLSEHGFVRVR